MPYGAICRVAAGAIAGVMGVRYGAWVGFAIIAAALLTSLGAFLDKEMGR